MSSNFNNDSNVKRSNLYTRGVQCPSDIKQSALLDNIVESSNGEVDDKEVMNENDSSAMTFDRVVNPLWKPRTLPR